MDKDLLPVLIEMIQTHPSYNQEYKNRLINKLENKETDEEEEKYFLEEQRNGRIEMFEKDGTFFNHDNQDLLIATFYDNGEAERVCKILNKLSF